MINKILVTGGAGKIGNYFVSQYKNLYNLSVLDIKTPLDPSIEYFHSDLNDRETLSKACKDVDLVIHLAGIPSADSSFDDVLTINMLGTKNLLDCMIENGVSRIIFASSAQTIEGYEKDIQVDETMPTNPGNYYGISKVFGESLISYFAKTKSIKAICLRIAAYEFSEDFTEMNARDMSAYLHPDDFNQVLSKAIGAIDQFNFEVFNVISNNTYKRLNITKAQRLLNYCPQYNSFDLFKLKR